MHRMSHRRNGRFVGVDCTALPPALVESELFGREKGAFTDAHSAQAGRFEAADGGTIFLDEIGELPAEAQAKLLRVIQFGEFERLGSPDSIRVNVRVVAATNRSLEEEVKAGRFRLDLYYRLSVFPITMPPLREHLEDLPALTQHLVERLSGEYQKRIDPISRSVIDELASHDWPGNVRELENVLERALIATSGSTLRLDDSQSPTPSMPEASTALSCTNLAEVQRAHIMRLLTARAWQIEGPRGAAAALGLKPSTLRSRMRKLGVRRTGPDISARTMAVASPCLWSEQRPAVSR
jgi:transcriptional regulator with GAF, ATPase, and Fis domain